MLSIKAGVNYFLKIYAPLVQWKLEYFIETMWS